MKTNYLMRLLVMTLLLYPNTMEAQCAMRKATVESSVDQPNSVAGGLNKGILYIMGVPYLLLVFIFRKQWIVWWKLKTGKYVPEEDL